MLLPPSPCALCVPCERQEAILAVAKHVRVCLVPEYFSSAKCPACRINGNVFLQDDPSTRSLHCARCGTTWPRDVAAAVNLENVVRQWMTDGTRPPYLDSPTAWRFTHGTDPVAWSTLSQEELEKMKGFTTPEQFITVFDTMLVTEAEARTARYGAGGKRAALGKRRAARARADDDDDDDDDDITPKGKPATVKRRARRRRRERDFDKGPESGAPTGTSAAAPPPAQATAIPPPATTPAASAPATTAAATSSTAASATVPTGLREAAGSSAPSSSPTTSAQHHTPISRRPPMSETGGSH